MEELDAFAAECAQLEPVLRSVGTDGWGRPALGEWSLHELLAHLARGVGRVAAYLDDPVPDDAPRVDRFRYWRGVPQLGAEVSRRAHDGAAATDGPTLVEAFASGWRRTVQRAREQPPQRPIATPLGVLRLDDYLSSRVLEVVVHGFDVRRALDLPPAPDPGAARIVVAVLEGLLGGPRPRAMGRDRFILVATGRVASDDERFPLLR